MTSTDPSAAPVRGSQRLVALDGLRGMATIMVFVSHYFAELPHGWRGLTFGWLGVDIFFVLSGYLVGKLVLERKDSVNFFTVFYSRRFLRTVPTYVLVVLFVFGLAALLGRPDWMEFENAFPIWSYLTFTQNFLMSAEGRIGPHWLAPSWTLAIEEHFYLFVPLVICVTPRRWLVAVLCALMVAGTVFRDTFLAGTMAAHVLFPGRMDELIAGILLAVSMQRASSAPHPALGDLMRILPPFSLLAVCAIAASGNAALGVISRPLVIIGCVALIYSLVRGSQEAKRFENRTLVFFGSISYSLYLTHVPVLGLVHGIVLQRAADIGDAAQIVVTLVALPLAVLTGWLLTKIVEEPLMARGRKLQWQAAKVPVPPELIVSAASAGMPALAKP